MPVNALTGLQTVTRESNWAATSDVPVAAPLPLFFSAAL